MQQGKNNIISEITRIHQIMGVNKQISEQVLLSTPVTVFKELASKLAKYAGTRRLDKTSRSLVTKLSKGTKKITNATGKIDEIPFDEDDYLNIFGKLRTSFDPGIRSIINAADNIILNFISTQTVPKTLNSPELLAKIQGDIQKGLNEDDVVDAMSIIFRNQIGVYADDVIDEFIDGVRKIYRDLTGKVPDDVVPPAPVKVVDTPIKVVDDGASDNIGGMLDGEKTPTPKEAEEVLEELADEENISREIAELSPLFNRYQNQTANEGVELANEAMSLIERRAGLTSLVGTDFLDLERQIKDLMERIWKWDKTYVEALEAEINNNIKFKDSPNLARWEKIRDDLVEIKQKFGRWGVREKSTNLSPTWILIKESLKSAFKLYVDIYKLAQSATGIIQFGKNVIDYTMNSFFRAKSGIDTQAKKVADDFASNAKAKVSIVWKLLVPGSPRGWPKRMRTENGVDVPNAYAAVQNSARSNQYLKAWLSLLLEKILVVFRVQVEYAFLMGSFQFLKFILTERKELMEKFGPCILETADYIKEGKLKLGDKNIDSTNLPVCLVELISSNKITKEQLGQFMVRAEFFSRPGGEITGYYTPYLFKAGKEDILRFFTGPLAGIAMKGIDDWYDRYIEMERTGDTYPVETGLRNFGQSLQQRLQTVEDAASAEMENLTRSEQDSLVQVVDSIQNASGGSDFIINTDD
jgi:hypothetical protein